MKRIGVYLSSFLLLAMTSCLSISLTDDYPRISDMLVTYEIDSVMYKTSISFNNRLRDDPPNFNGEEYRLSFYQQGSGFGMQTSLYAEEQKGYFVVGKKYYFSEQYNERFKNNLTFSYPSKSDSIRVEYPVKSAWYSFRLSDDTGVAYIIDFDFTFTAQYYNSFAPFEYLEEKEFRINGNIRISKKLESRAANHDSYPYFVYIRTE